MTYSIVFVNQEKEKDKEFGEQLQKEIKSHEEQLTKLELEVCVVVLIQFNSKIIENIPYF